MSDLDDLTPSGRRSSRQKKKLLDLKCGNKLCNDVIDDKKKRYIKCERCQENFHLKCSGMNVDALKFIIDNNCVDSFIKCCLSCQPHARKEISSIIELENRIKEVDKKLDESVSTLEKNLNKKMDLIKNTLTNVNLKITENVNSIKGEIETMAKTLQNSNMDEIGKKIGEITTLEKKITTQAEINDKNWRANNLVFFNIPESDSITSADRKKDDCEKIKCIFERNQFSFLADKVLNVIRLGANRNKTRPIKMIFSSQQYKSEVLKYCKNLKYIKDSQSIPIYCSLDLTKSEQEARRLLVSEFKQKR